MVFTFGRKLALPPKSVHLLFSVDLRLYGGV